MKSESLGRRSGQNMMAAVSITGAFVAAGVAIATFGRSTPQMGASEQVFKTIDALYTAVRNEDSTRVSQCAERLRGYRDTGKLPASAADALDAIIATARSGRWQHSARSLYAFMKGQRREGAIEYDTKTNNPVPGKAKVAFHSAT